MNAKPQMRNLVPSQFIKILSIAGLLLAVIVGCSPVSTQPPEQPTPSATEPQITPTAPLATATSQALIPAGWATHTSQQCDYAISYPSEMQVTDETPYSQTLWFKLTNPEEGARNFIYISVIDPDIESMVNEGVYDHDVYNYDPVETETLLNMQVGESKAVHELPSVESGFTYQRMPDTPISGQAAQTYENLQPWEFPSGTKEIRYYLSLGRCTYLIGGYMDATSSNQPGAITEELFYQIIATIQLLP